MTNKPKMSKNIEALQNNSDFVILNNPLANPKFVRAISKNENRSISVKEIYVPKLFFEIASKLKPEDLEQIKVTESIQIEIQIKQFAEAIGTTNSSNFYTEIKKTAEYLRSTAISFKGNDGLLTTVGILTKTKTDEKGKIIVFIDGELAQKILEVKESGNFSFLKQYIFGLQNGQSIKLYPFFKSWLNHGRYETGLDRFKEQFGYNTSGYVKFSNFEAKVLKSATEEINEKTDIIVTYETTGENLDGLRPRVTGLIFWITSKEKVKILPNGQPHTPQKTSEPEAVQETAAPPQTERTQIIENQNNSELYTLFKKIAIKNRPDEITASVLVDSWCNSLGYEVVKDGFLGMVATKAQPETVAFFTPDNFKKYIGYSKKQEEQEAKKRETQEAQRREQEQERFFKDLEYRYNEDKRKHYQKKYNELTGEDKEQYLQELWEGEKLKSVYFKNSNINDPNSYAIEKIGENLTFPNGYDYQKAIKGYALKTFAVQIDFDQNNKMIFANLVNAPIEGDPVPVGKFDREKAQQQTAPENIKAIESEVKQEQNEIKPTTSHISKRTSNEEEAPKGVKGFLSKFF
jgi:plasmid replication initiation protein